MIIQSLCCPSAQFVIEQNTGISHIRFRLSKSHGFDLGLIDFILVSEILCLGLRQLPFWSVLMITFDSSWSNLLSSCRWLPDLKHCVPFFSTCLVSTCCVAKTSPAVGIALLCSRVLGSRSLAVLFTGSRVPSLAVSICSRPFGTCFDQPTSHSLGLKASVVHDHCKRHCCGHRISNLLNTLVVKGLQYVAMCILPSSVNCTFVTRLAKHSVSTACQEARLKSDIHT